MLESPLNFAPGYQLPADAALGPNDWWFLFQKNRLLIDMTNGDSRPLTGKLLSAHNLAAVTSDYMGRMLDDAAPHHCFWGALDDDVTLPPGIEAFELRRLFGQTDDLFLALAGRAQQLLAWTTMHRYCGRCAAPTAAVETELARVCPECGSRSYPNPAPAIIIAITRTSAEQGAQILLVRNHRFPPDRYSVIAGFVEPGESLEDCCRREVQEEVGVQIENVRYFGSQAWPFPNSLMVGFTADYAGGEFVLEDAEIAAAGWFSADALPKVPPRVSIARALIDAFVSEQGRDPLPLADWES